MPYVAGQRPSADAIAEAALKLAQGVTDLMPCFNLSISATEFVAAPVAEKLSIQRFFANSADGNGGASEADDAEKREAAAKMARRATRGTIDSMFKRATARQAAVAPGQVTATTVKQAAQPEHARQHLPAPDPPRNDAHSPIKTSTIATAPDQPSIPVVVAEKEAASRAQPGVQDCQPGSSLTARHSASGGLPGAQATEAQATEARAAGFSKSASECSSARLPVPDGPLLVGGSGCSSPQVIKHDGSRTADVSGRHGRPAAACAEGNTAYEQQRLPQVVEADGVSHAASPLRYVGHCGDYEVRHHITGGSDANHEGRGSQADNVQLNAISINEQRRILNDIRLQQRTVSSASLLQQSGAPQPAGNTRNLKRPRGNKQTQLLGFFSPKP